MTAPRLDAGTLARAEIRALGAYALDLSPCRHKLDQNEVPWEPTVGFKAEAAARLLSRPWRRYPDFHGEALRARLAEIHGWRADGILVGNGSNELLAAALATVAGPGREVLGLLPSFGLYPVFARANGAHLRGLGPRPDLALPLDELEREVKRDPTRPVLIAAPNNPTGEAVPVDRIERLASQLAAPLLLDNAYGEFCRFDYRPLLARCPNLLLFRTFSKAWSLAGLRVGYLLADPALVAEVVKVKLPYNLGHAGAVIAELALEPAHARRAARAVRVLVARRESWRRLLERCGAEVVPSEGNFLLTRWPMGELERVRERLARASIRVRDVSAGAGLAGCLRFSVGDGAALVAVARALGQPSPRRGSAGGRVP